MVSSEKEATLEIDASTLDQETNSQSMSNATDGSENIRIITELNFDCNPLLANVNVDATNTNDKTENTQMSDKQRNSPDFNHIFKNLSDKELPDDDKLAKSTVIESEQYTLLDQPHRAKTCLRRFSTR